MNDADYTFAARPSDRMAASWHGSYRRKDWPGGKWATASSKYGPIEYTSREYALHGARVCAEVEDEKTKS
jgi:hypothetical protein